MSYHRAYTPDDLGLDWGDIKSGIKKAFKGGKDIYDIKKEAELRKKLAAESGNGGGAPPPGFFAQYGKYLVLGGIGIAAILYLRSRKKS